MKTERTDASNGVDSRSAADFDARFKKHFNDWRDVTLDRILALIKNAAPAIVAVAAKASTRCARSVLENIGILHLETSKTLRDR